MSKATIYAHQSLAACGFAVMNPMIAWQLRPDLWASGQDCGNDIISARMQVADVPRYQAKLAGLDAPVLVLARSTDMLAQRIEWVTGYPVTGLETYSPPRVFRNERTQARITDAERQKRERLARLHDLAAQEPPAHDCALRKDILAARCELERLAA